MYNKQQTTQTKENKMNHQSAIDHAKKHFSQFRIYTRGNEVIVRDQASDELITKIPFVTVSQPELF